VATAFPRIDCHLDPASRSPLTARYPRRHKTAMAASIALSSLRRSSASRPIFTKGSSVSAQAVTSMRTQWAPACLRFRQRSTRWTFCRFRLAMRSSSCSFGVASIQSPDRIFRTKPIMRRRYVAGSSRQTCWSACRPCRFQTANRSSMYSSLSASRGARPGPPAQPFR
jgi:hypothetical protein